MLYIVVPQTSRNSQIILRISGTGVRMHTLAFAKEQLFLITCKISRSIDLRYGTKKIFLYRDSEISESWQKFFSFRHCCLISNFLRNFAKISEKQKFLSSENFQASVEFLYRIVSYRFFRGRNKMVQWMVEILQVLT